MDPQTWNKLAIYSFRAWYVVLETPSKFTNFTCDAWHVSRLYSVFRVYQNLILSVCRDFNGCLQLCLTMEFFFCVVMGVIMCLVPVDINPWFAILLSCEENWRYHSWYQLGTNLDTSSSVTASVILDSTISSCLSLIVDPILARSSPGDT
jgi:hypothetical protein